MAAPTTPSAVAPSFWESDEWECINDDGFVYMRKRHRLDPTALARPPDPAPDPAAEERERRKRKRKALLKVKEKYQREILRWEHLLNTLKAMEESAKSKSQQDKQVDGKEVETRKEQEVRCERSQPIVSLEKHSRTLIDVLLFQVEAQDATLGQLSHLCDVAQSLCYAQEEKANQYFLDLPIWSSPDELMTSLCED